MLIRDVYKKLLLNEEIIPDPNQLKVIEFFSKIEKEILEASKSNFLNIVFKYLLGKNIKLSILLSGDVGCGKTFLMDLFYNNLCIKNTKKIHMHKFLIEINNYILKEKKTNKNVVEKVAKKIFKKYKIIFLDEIYLIDRSDSIVITVFINSFIKAGGIIIGTSNKTMAELFQNIKSGNTFRDKIDYIEKNLHNIEMYGGKDYREREVEYLNWKRFFFPNIKGQIVDEVITQKFLNKIKEKINGNKFLSKTINVRGRDIILDKQYKNIAYIDFNYINNRPFGNEDFIKLSKMYNTVFIDNLEKIDSEDKNTIKRFISLIDIFYDAKVKVYIKSGISPSLIYKGRAVKFEFARCLSRLKEMQVY